MADKKVTPKNPAKDTTTKGDDDKAETRKTAAFKIKRKASGFRH
jgi:hypothetical protein